MENEAILRCACKIGIFSIGESGCQGLIVQIEVERAKSYLRTAFFLGGGGGGGGGGLKNLKILIVNILYWKTRLGWSIDAIKNRWHFRRKIV